MRAWTTTAASIAIAAACGSDVTSSSAFYSGGCTLDDARAEPCAACLRLELATTLGAQEDDGFLADRGTLGDIVRDHGGNYWVGQREEIKVFDSAGVFVSAVGRAGQGPMEFAFAQPMHTDSRGNVHVFDNRNARVSVVTPEFTLFEHKNLPATAVFAMTPVADGDRYAIQAWIPDAEGFGLPVHIVRGREIIKSFGAAPESDPAMRGLEAFVAQRRLATDPAGNIFSSRYYDYLIEAWSAEGERIGRLQGPVLNDGPRVPGPWTWEDPPWNEIHDLMVDSSGLLWIVFRHRRPDWRTGMVEQVGPQGEVRLVSADGTLASYYHSRIDVVDLQSCSTLASRWHDGVLMNFVEEGMVSEVSYGDDGQEFVNIWRLARVR